jgi:AcrR family transcriptional regulator
VTGSGGSGEDRLGSLPPGRHGLSKEFVTRNQRERLVAGTIAAVAADGFRDTGVTAISAASGVSRRTFYTYFKDKEECFLATYDLFEGHLFAVMADESEKRTWPEQVRRRVRALIDLYAANPDLVRFSLAAPPSAGGAIDARARSFLERLVDALCAGHPGEASEVERGALAGTIAAILIARVEDGDPLPDAAAELVELVLSPYLGRTRAIAEAKKT